MSDSSIYKWIIRKGAEPNTVVLEMVDAWGWTITGVGALQADKTYAGTATVGDKGRLTMPFDKEP